MVGFFFGHHKCATTWVLSILYDLASQAGLRHKHFHSHKMMDYDLARAITVDRLDLCSYTNARYADINVDEFRGFHIIRDPRDILVSAYFSHLNSHETAEWPELVEHRKQLKAMPQEEGLLYSFEFSDRLPTNGHDIQLMTSLANWNYRDERILEIKFEDLIKTPYERFVSIFRHLNLLTQPKSVAAERLGSNFLNTILSRKGQRSNRLGIADVLYAVYDNRFEKKAEGRQLGSENKERHYRKGTPGDWNNYFKQCHKNEFKYRYPGLLQKLGYEANEDW